MSTAKYIFLDLDDVVCNNGTYRRGGSRPGPGKVRSPLLDKDLPPFKKNISFEDFKFPDIIEKNPLPTPEDRALADIAFDAETHGDEE